MTWETTHDNIEAMALYMERFPQGVHVNDLVKEFGVDRATIHRRMQKLDDRYGITPVERGVYRLAEPLRSVRLRKAEALTIYLALRRFIRQSNKMPDFMLSAIQKIIRVMVREDLRDNLEGAATYLRQYRPSTEVDTLIWQTLIDAWLEQRVVRIDYLKPGQLKADTHTCEIYLFEPMNNGDGVYVIVWSRERGGIRQFKIDRIQRVITQMEQFERRGDLDIDRLLMHALGVWMADDKHPLQEVVLHFSPEKASRVMESVYIEMEQKELQDDGSLIWRAEVAALREIKHWILGWGAGVEVLEPQKLRNEIAMELQAAAGLYDER